MAWEGSVEDLSKAIAIVNPDLYSDKEKKKDLKEAIRKEGATSSAAWKAAKGRPLASFKLIYDAPTSQLEPIYFWILDFMQEGGQQVEKVTDNFMASPGSGHFGEMGQRASTLLQQGMNSLGAINQVIKSVIQLIYDLKEFEIRLKHYEDAKSKDKATREAGMLALKQIWLDNVDMKRGRGSVHQMTYELGFTTLRDVFMICNSIEEAEKMANEKDGVINDQVKRILIPRISEFLKWQDLSEKELKKRYQVERSYLRSQVETVKLYTSWAKPYLKAAEELKNKGFESKDFLVNSKNPALVNMFNTAMFELVLLGKSSIKIDKEIVKKTLPASFKNYESKRKYHSINVVSFVFRGIPQKVTNQAYGFGGRVEMVFNSYSLNDDELALLKKILEKESLGDAFKFSYETTEESLEQLQEDINHFLDEDKEEEKKEEKKKEDDLNPFSALFSIFKGDEKKKDKKDKKEIEDLKDIKKDDYVESYLRKLTSKNANGSLYTTYDVYKKAHGHASSPEGFDV